MGFAVKIPFLDLSPQTGEVATEFFSVLKELVDQSRFIGGEPVEAFEQAFGRFCGSPHCVSLNSGTDALRLSLIAAGLEGDDEVVTSPFTFIATAEAISQTCVLKLADVEPETFTLSAAAVKEQVSPRLKAVLPVHIFGLPADMCAFQELANEYDLFLLEDACQAHGAVVESKRVGSIGAAAAFSFYPSKNLGAFGDAGAVTCRDAEFAEMLCLLRNHGQVGSYLHQVEGFNSRMDSLQAAVLSLKLKYLEEWNRDRQRLAEVYFNELAGLGEIRFQFVPPGYHHVYHVFAIIAEERDDLRNHLDQSGIETRIIYPVPIHLNPAYKHLGLGRGDLPNAEFISSSILCLPIYPGLKRSQVFEISRQIRRFYGKR